MEEKRILLSHGSGGTMTRDLIDQYFVKQFGNPMLNLLNDQAVFPTPSPRLAFTTDSYVIDPIFFPGGDIGKLAVCGTVNDLAVSGAIPQYLSCSFMIEEGFLFSDLKKILQSMKEACQEAEVTIVTGDTKVVNRGGLDKIFINTAGVGSLEKGISISGDKARVGDKVLITGFLGDHEIAVISKRENLGFVTHVLSDVAPMNGIVKNLLKNGLGHYIHAMRDPTRGGLATVLNEIASQSQIGMIIEENKIPVREEVRGACEILGFDPLYLANEGKLAIFMDPEKAEEILSVIKKTPYGADARLIGEVTDKPKGKVLMNTAIGGTRIVDMLATEQFPRIC